MNDIFQLHFSNDSLNTMTPGRTKTPGDVGDSVFETLLSRIDDSSEDIHFGSSLYQGKETGGNNIPDKDRQRENSNSLEKLDKEMSCLFLPNARFVLPESVMPQLIAFLKEQGFSMEKINRMILSIKNKDGSLQVDKLLAQLFSNESGTIQQGKSPVIQSSQIPRVEELLFKIGLGAGEVKEVIENSVNKKGDLVFDRLTGSLEKYYTGPDLKSNLISLLRKNDVTVNSQSNIIENETLNPELKNKVTRFIDTLSPEFLKEIKQNLAVLLRDKGVPPQEVKSFLETMNIEFTRSLLKKNSDQAPEINTLLNHAFLKNQPRWRTNGWHDKIMSILKDNNNFITKSTNGGSFQEQGDIKLNLTELLKQGDIKLGTELLLGLSEDKKNSKFDKTGTRIYYGNRDFLTKDGVGADLSLNKTYNDLKSSAAIDRARNYYLPEPLPKVLDRMIWMIQAGEQKSRILIHPPELGRLDLNLAIKNGHLQANLSAESVMVKEIIEANLNQLKQQLNEQGLIVDRFEVMVGLGDGRFKEGTMWSWNEPKDSFSTKKSAVKNGMPLKNDNPVEKSTDSPYQIDVHV